MSTATLDATRAHGPASDGTTPLRSRAAGPAGHLGGLNAAAVSAGLTAFVFYTTAGVPLLIAIAGRLGLDAAHTSSWFFVVFFSTAVTSVALSLVYRQPLPINWSLPGLVYLGSLAGQFGFPELVGANLMAGAAIALVGLLGLGGRLLAVLPLPIALGMFGGSILGNLSELVTATVDDVPVAGATVAGYLLGRLLGGRRVPPVAFAVLGGGIPVLLAQPAIPAPVAWSPPVVLVPEARFSLSAFVAVSLPLVVFSAGLGNVQGLGFLVAQGYRVPANAITLVVGLQSVVNALFGGHQAIVGRSGVAILASPEAGPLAGRYWGCLLASGLLVPVAFAAAPLASLLPLVPHAYVAALAGLAILPAFQDALVQALGGRLRFGATVAFVVAATPFAVGGITSAFWALPAGLVASLVAERGELLSRGRTRAGGSRGPDAERPAAQDRPRVPCPWDRAARSWARPTIPPRSSTA
jgi:benzoate membrane transport protein